MTIPDRNISQSNKALHSLGESLWNDFQALIEEYTTGWLNQDYLVNSDFREILNLEKAISPVLQVEESFDAFEKWLTSGFIPEGLVVSNGELEKDFSSFPVEDYLREQGGEEIRTVILEEEGNNYIQPNESLKPKSDLDTVPEMLIQQESAIAISSVTDGDITQEVNKVQAQSQEITSLSNQHEEEEVLPIEQRTVNKVKGLGDLAQFLASEEPSAEIFISDGDVTDADITQKVNKVQVQSQEIFSLSNQYEEEEILPIEQRTVNKVKGLGDLAQFLASGEPSGEITIFDGDVNQELKELESYFIRSENNLGSLLKQHGDKNLTGTEAEILAEKPNDISIKSQILDNEQSVSDQQVESSQILQGEASNKKIDFTDESNYKSFDELNFLNSTQMEEEINLDSVLEALTQEINREYRRFYGG